MLRSLHYGAVSAFGALLLGLCIAYIVARRAVAFSSVLAVLALVPLVIPAIVLAIGFYATYAPPPLALYGTATILILAFITRFLPLAYSTCASAIRDIHPEMEDAVRILGGGRLHGAAPGGDAAAEASAGRRVAAGVRAGGAGTVDGGVPGRAAARG